MRRTPRRIRALTLIETVAVVTVGSGAMALLLPTFKDAREAAKLQTCLSNLGQINRAFLGYIHDLQALPFYYSGDCWGSWTYGGWSGTSREYWENWGCSGLNVQTADRPLSVYMTSWKIPQEVDPLTPTQEMPLFRCPSDQGDPGECQYTISDYEHVGTSYQANIQWFSQLTGDFEDRLGKYALQLVRKYMDKAAGRFILLMEGPADDAFSNYLSQSPGWHGQFSTHNVGYADGSVENVYLDTRHGHDSVPYPPGPKHGARENLGIWSVVDWQNNHTSGGRHQ